MLESQSATAPRTIKHQHGIMDFEMKFDKKKMGEAALGGVIGAAMGSVSAASTMAASGAVPDGQDAVGHLWAGAIGGALAAYESETLDKKPADSEKGSETEDSDTAAATKVHHVAHSERVAAMKKAMSAGAMAGLIGGSIAQVFSGSSDEGGSSASSGASSSSSSKTDPDGGGVQAGGGLGQNPRSLASSGHMPIIHNAVAGALGGAAVGYMEPEILMLGGSFGGLLQNAAASIGKHAGDLKSLLKGNPGTCTSTQFGRDGACFDCVTNEICEENFGSSSSASECSPNADGACKCNEDSVIKNDGKCGECADSETLDCSALAGSKPAKCDKTKQVDAHCVCRSAKSKVYLMHMTKRNKDKPTSATRCKEGVMNADVDLLRKGFLGSWERTVCDSDGSSPVKWENFNLVTTEVLNPASLGSCDLPNIKGDNYYNYWVHDKTHFISQPPGPEVVAAAFVEEPSVYNNLEEGKFHTKTWFDTVFVKGFAKFCGAQKMGDSEFDAFTSTTDLIKSYTPQPAAGWQVTEFSKICCEYQKAAQQQTRFPLGSELQWVLFNIDENSLDSELNVLKVDNLKC